MKKSVCVLILGVALGSSEARAQTVSGARAFFDVNGGVQALTPTLDSVGTFQLFGETGTVHTTQKIGAGPLIDARFGHRVGERLALAFAVSGFRKESAGQGTASVPSPIFIGSPTITTIQTSGLKRREVGYHPQLAWFVHLSEKLDVSIYGGPSFVHLEQNVVSATVSAASTVSIGTSNQTGMAFGAHGGIDATRPVSDRFGVGVFARYVFAKVNLPAAAGVKVGGLQVGGGVRFRF